MGIAIQKPDLHRRLDVEAASVHLATFLESTRKRIATYLRAMGHRSAAELGLDDLVPPPT